MWCRLRRIHPIRRRHRQTSCCTWTVWQKTGPGRWLEWLRKRSPKSAVDEHSESVRSTSASHPRCTRPAGNCPIAPVLERQVRQMRRVRGKVGQFGVSSDLLDRSRWGGVTTRYLLYLTTHVNEFWKSPRVSCGLIGTTVAPTNSGHGGRVHRKTNLRQGQDHGLCGTAGDRRRRSATVKC